MNSQKILLITLVMLTFVLSNIGCVSLQKRVDHHIDIYKEIALSRYRDPSLWQQFNYVDQPRISNPTKIQYREEIGVGWTGLLTGNFPVVTIWIPIRDPDKELKGLDHVFVKFHHPSRTIIMVGPGSIMFH